jgi:glutamyl-tRNA reductase
LAAKSKVEQNLADRKRESKKCCHLIERYIQEFQPWVEHSAVQLPDTDQLKTVGEAGRFVPEFAVK